MLRRQPRYKAPSHLRVDSDVRQIVQDDGSRESTMKNPCEKKYILRYFTKKKTDANGKF